MAGASGHLGAARRELERLRVFRRERTPDIAIAGELSRLLGTLTRGARTTASIEEAFERLVPANLKGRVRVTAWTRGILTVRADDPAARYDADRWLKGPGLRALAAASGKGISKVRFASR